MMQESQYEFNILDILPCNLPDPKPVRKAVCAFPDTSAFTKKAIAKYYPDKLKGDR
ncbi:hypothetical protein [Pseudanabaena sp. 'Roaring Creek']|uniref:hypothetical protein n=1 Tax=Pseudanabaena sp. 'Roaring Creek' TaxID=1681830 RepID=UPI000B29CFA2|nr:hypothetical protein [Pseudanabaena sp. 'Roaring Creek']